MRTAKLIPSCLLIVAAVALLVSGCGDSGGSDMSNLSGAWQDPSTKQKFQIDFSNNKTTITFGDAIVPVTIKALTSDSYSVRVSDKSQGEKEWKLSRVWDDKRKFFTLKFERDNATTHLERLKI
jgi:hypothetical protein